MSDLQKYTEKLEKLEELGEFLNSEVKIEGYVHQMRKLKYVILTQR